MQDRFPLLKHGMQTYFVFLQSLESLRSDRMDMGNLRQQKAGNNDPAQSPEHVIQQIFVGVGSAKLSPGICVGHQQAEYLDCLSISVERINRRWKGASVSPQLENKIDGPRFGVCFCRTNRFIGFIHDLGQMMGKPTLKHMPPFVQIKLTDHHLSKCQDVLRRPQDRLGAQVGRVGRTFLPGLRTRLLQRIVDFHHHVVLPLPL